MHPDHICVHQATRIAFYAAVETGINSTEFLNYKPQKLYYYTISKKVMRWLARILCQSLEKIQADTDRMEILIFVRSQKQISRYMQRSIMQK